MYKVWLMFLARQSARDRGFTMMEVLVAILAATAFLLGTLQAVAINAVLQVRAERQVQASFWIQEDLERVKAAAKGVKNSTSSVSGTPLNSCGANFFYSTMAAAPGGELMSFARRLERILDNNLVDSDGTGKEANGTNTATISPVYSETNAASSSTNLHIQVAPSRQIVNKTYRLVRIINPDSKTPNVLKITYRVGEPDNSEKTAADRFDDSDDGTTNANPAATGSINSIDMLANDRPGRTSIIAELYAEVIPNEALTGC